MEARPDSATAREDEILSLRALVSRPNEATGKIWQVDTLFPRVLEGRVDTNAIDEGTAALLTGMVQAVKPLCVLETGTHKGRSTRAIAEALCKNQYGHMFTVDMNDYGLLTDGAIRDDEQEYVTQIVGKTPEVFAEEPLYSLMGIDLAFLDGAHDRDGLVADIEYVEAHRAAECLVVVENALDPGWPELSEFFADYTDYFHVSLPTVTGLQLIQMR